MNVLSMVGNILSGGTLGVVGAIGSGYIGLLQARQKNAHDLAVMAANLEVAKAAGTNAATLETIKLTAGSYDADKATYACASGIDIYRGSVRPSVCYFLVMMATWLGFWAFSRVGLSDSAISEIARESVNTCLNMASMSVAWYFGARHIKKS